MTTIRPEPPDHGVCTYCAGTKPIHIDGTVSTHYLRTRQAERSRKRKCPGSRQAPRPPLDPAEAQIVNAADQALREVQRASKQLDVIKQAWTRHFGETP